MEKFATRPLTASSTLARLNSATSQTSAAGQKLTQVQMKEFGDKQRQPNGFTMSFHSPARPASANPIVAKPSMIYSTINKDLKLELKKHVPLYNHREMGHIMYKETTSKIVRPRTASASYKGMVKQPPGGKFLKFELDTTTKGRASTARTRAISKAGAELHIKPEFLATRVSAQQGKNASIMGVDLARDNYLQATMPQFFVCRPYSSGKNSTLPNRYLRAKRNIELLDQLETEIQTPIGSPMEYWRRRSHFTVFDAAKRQAALDYYKPEKVIFENDANFVTLAKITN